MSQWYRRTAISKTMGNACGATALVSVMPATNDNSGWEWGRIQRDFIKRHPTCEGRYYGCLGVATDVHHVVARVHGGGDNEENLESRCRPCHDRDTAELNQKLAKERRAAKKAARRKNHPGRKDRYE